MVTTGAAVTSGETTNVTYKEAMQKNTIIEEPSKICYECVKYHYAINTI